MSRAIRIAAAVASALAALYVAVALALPLVVDADRFRARVEARLADVLGRRVALKRLTLSLWTGVALVGERLEIGESPGSTPDSAVALDAERVSVRPEIFPLLRGDLRLRSVSLGGGALRAGGRVLADGLSASARLGRGGDSSTAVAGSVSGALRTVRGAPHLWAVFDGELSPDRLRLASLRASAGPGRFSASGDLDGLSTGRLRLSVRGEADVGRTHAEGSLTAHSLDEERPELAFEVTSPLVDFDELARLAGIGGGSSRSAGLLDGLVPGVAAAEPPAPRPGFLTRAAFRGTVEAARGRLAGLEVTDLRVDMTAEGGSARFEEARFGLYGGLYRGLLAMDFASPGAPFRLAGRLDGVDADRMISALSPSRGGVLHGVASLTLDLGGEAGAGSAVRSIRGSVRAEVRDGRFSTVGILKQVAQILEMAGGRGIGRDETPFDHVSASFLVRDSRADTDDLEFRSADLDLDGGGSLGLDGALFLDVTASFSKPASADLVRETPQLKFRVDPDGRLTMPLKIRGDLRAPIVQLDLDRVLREGLERSAKDAGRRGLLRRLLGEN